MLLALATVSFAQSAKNDLKLTMAAVPLTGHSDEFVGFIMGIALKPSIGYFISDKTSIDMNFSYVSYDKLTVGLINSNYVSYGFIPAIRYHAVNNQKLRIFTEMGFGLGTIKYKPDNAQNRNPAFEQLSGGISILNIGVGMNYYFNPKFGLEIIIPYVRTKNITSDYTDVLYSGLGPTVGLTFKLN